MATASFRNRFKFNGEETTVVDHSKNGKKVGFIAKIFGCGHQDLSRPFSRGRLGYRTCLHCGAQKQFDPETLKTFGDFYYPSVYKADT